MSLSAVPLPSEIVDALNVTDGAVTALDARFDECTEMLDAERVAWGAFRETYRAFAASKHRAYDGILATLGIAFNSAILLQWRSDDARVTSFEHQIRGWQEFARKRCGGLAGTLGIGGGDLLIPRDERPSEPLIPKLTLPDFSGLPSPTQVGVTVLGVGAGLALVTALALRAGRALGGGR